MRYTIWYHFYKLKKVKNTRGGVLLLVLKVTLLHGCFLPFLICANGTKSHKASQNNILASNNFPIGKDLVFLKENFVFIE